MTALTAGWGRSATGVEVTLMDASLQLHTTSGGIALSLTNDQAREFHQELSRIPDSKLDSDATPVILGEVAGAGVRSRSCARPISGLSQRDCQISEAVIALEGNRLFVTKDGARAFVQLNDSQLAQVSAEIGDLHPSE